ncbi:MAG: mechanosensitive ion channel family protein [Elusimicrobiota bacterium]
MQSNLTQKFNEFLSQGAANIPKIVTILAILVILTFILRIILWRVEVFLINKAGKIKKISGEQSKRIKTLSGIIRKFIYVLLWAVGLTLILSELGVNIGPILTAAGVFGLAISFGAQNLVRDLIGGFFMLIENQVRVGDVAIINGTGGLVEAINLRTIILRDLSGSVHIFPNGTINTLANLTKEWSGYIFDIGVAYKEDVDNVISVMRTVADELAEDEEYGKKIIDPIEIFGLDKFDNSAVVIKGRIKTKPLEQWGVGREFKRRIKKAFDENDIEIPFPHTSLYFGEASKPIEVLFKNSEKMKDILKGKEGE